MSDRTRPEPLCSAPMNEITRIPVGGEQAYDVVVGRGLTDQLSALPARADRVAVLARRCSRPGPTRSRPRCGPTAARSPASRSPTPRAARPSRRPPPAGDRLGAAGFTRSDAVVGGRRRRRHRPGRATSAAGPAARRAGGTGADHRCSAWSTRRSAARPASTSRSRQEPGRCVPPAGRGALRPRRARPCSPCRATTTPAGPAEVIKCGFIAEPGILDLVERRPGRRRHAGRHGTPRHAHRTCHAGESRRGRRRPTRESGRSVSSSTSWHTLGPRDREGRALHLVPARRHGRGHRAWSTRPS